MPDASASETLVPLYRQVSDSLRRAIMAGEVRPGEALPTEDALCASYGVSRITVRRALDELAERHLIVRRRGVGTFVADAKASTWSVTLTGFLEEVLSPNRLTLVRTATVRPAADVLDFARLPADTRLVLFEGTNHVADGGPLVHLHYYFPTWIGARLTGAMLSGSAHVIRVVERVGGVELDHAEQLVLPTIASGRIARQLRVRSGTPVLRAIRVYYDASQRPIEIFDGAYHPTNYRYTARLYPRASGATHAAR